MPSGLKNQASAAGKATVEATRASLKPAVKEITAEVEAGTYGGADILPPARSRLQGIQEAKEDRGRGEACQQEQERHERQNKKTKQTYKTRRSEKQVAAAFEGKVRELRGLESSLRYGA